MLSPFVGRKHELERLHASLAAAGDGHGGLAVLVGPAGIGKTRCVEEAIARLELPPGRILRGRSSEQTGAPAFWPWRRALRPFFTRQADATLRDSLGLDAAALAALIPELRTRLPDVSRDAAADPQEGRFALLEGVSSWLLRAAASESLVVFLDDIQWADASSLELLALLAPDLAESHAMLLCTWREPAPRTAEAWLPRLRRVGDVIEMPGLDLGETSALVRQRATTPPPDDWIAWLHRKTAGNPFFVDEIVRVWSARGGLATDESGDDPAPPESVREVVRGHLAPLPDDVRAWLALGAVLGQEFDVALLAAASACDAETVLGGLTPALDLHLVEAIPGTQRFRFVHALIAETLYGDLSPRERATLHRQVGVAIEARRDALALPVAELAYHFYRAAPLGEAARAVDYAERAGREATDQHAHAEAALHFRHALDALSWLPPDEPKRLALLLEIGRAQSSAGAEAPAREAFERAAQLATAQSDAASLARAALGFARVNLEIGVVNPVTVRLLESAQSQLGAGDTVLRAAIAGQLSAALYFSDERERRDALSREAVDVARADGEPQALATALLMRHFICWGPDNDPATLLPLADEALPLAEAVRDRRIHVQLQRWRILDLIEHGALPEAEAEAERMVRSCDAWRLPSYRLHARVIRGALALIAGRVREAGEGVPAEYDGRFGGPISNLAQTFAIHRFLTSLHCGGLESSEPILRLASRLPIGTWRAALSLLLFELDRGAEARAELDDFFARGPERMPRDGNFLSALALAAETAYGLGARDVAAALLPLLAPHAQRHVAFGVGAGGGGSVARYLGLAAATTGAWDDAVAHFDAAIASNERAGARTFAAYARHELARALRERGAAGDTERAAALFAQAREAAERLGIPRLARRIDAESDAPRVAIAAAAPASAEIAVLRREAESWRVGLGARSFHLRDTKGLGYLATLLREPGREWHAMDLAGGASSSATSAAGARELAEAGLATDAGLGDAGAWLDPQARADYQARLAELEEEQAEAERFNDPERAARAREEIAFLAQELAHGVGLGGRERRAGSAAERARLNVSRALAAVLRRIAAADAALGEHLAATVRTGLFCSYTPDPRRPLEWDLQN